MRGFVYTLRNCTKQFLFFVQCTYSLFLSHSVKEKKNAMETTGAFLPSV
ncbi:hypothetical protein US8_00476 [Bacillus altitudinis]|nr:hypothetical protein US8_00476 [Bacillus altitudinis]